MKIYPLIFSMLLSGCSSIKMLTPGENAEPTEIKTAELVVDVEVGRSIASKNSPKVEEPKQVEKQELKKVAPKEEKEEEEEVTPVAEPAENEVAEAEGIQRFELNYPERYYRFWIKYFTGKQRKLFTRHQANGEVYRETVEKIFEEHGLPKELFYVGLIESGFNTKIRSRADAVGPWQFIKGTAKRYGLRVDRSIDERYNIHKSTHAAASYFKDLYNIFGSWELALCAYNAGEYRIIGAIRKGRTRDYQELVRKKLLPSETIYYIPKVAAARELVLNRSKYDFPSFKNEHKKGRIFENASSKTLYKKFNWKTVARQLNVKQSDFKTLNPDLKWVTITATGRRPVEIYLPKVYSKRLAQEIPPKSAQYRTADTNHYRKISTPNKTTITYKVRRGDNFHAIAKRFNVPVKDLIELNKIKRRNHIVPGQRIKIPANKSVRYTVRRGDNLTFIAKKYHTSIYAIMKANGLKKKNIYVGQVLRIPN